MSRIAYVNGRYASLGAPAIAIEDRAVQFGDSIYEVWSLRGGALQDEAGHFARLWRSLREIRIAAPMSEGALRVVLMETARRNRVRDGLVYLQISRGVARRDHAFPNPPPAPTLIVTASSLAPRILAQRARGVGVITRRDERWARADIKSTNLLANVLGKEAARAEGAFEVWFTDGDGLVTEGASSNAWIVDAAGVLRTRPLSHHILPGVTRARILDLAALMQIKVEERAFSVEEAKEAREAFLTSATNIAVPVIRIDGVPVGEGRPGPVARALRGAYFGAATAEG